PGTGSNNTVELVANGSAQMGVSDTISVIAGQAKGMGITGVGVVYQHNPTALLIRKASLTAAQASTASPPLSMLYGKTYGAVITGSPYYFWKAFLKQQHLNESQIKTVNIAAPGFTQMATGQVDFIATFFTTAPVLEGMGVPLKVLKLADYGQQAYGLSYLVNNSFMHQHANAIKAFLKVTARAITYTNQHPEEGVKILCKYNKSICSSQKALGTNVQEQKLQIPLYQNLQAGKPIFCTDAAVWKKTQELDLIAGVISKAPDPATSFTNRFIDGC
ncbi:MAG: ABC transporter substrate-binding protein, partial [Candidatus Dormibacteraceae bacterium]